ncbi:hypothetical protein SAMN04489798_0815 [Pseudomonas arsenicoxydans]|uniref:DUF6916 domain-containing protein n=1 Tax=Pseudomonas arsenicoxydans TaxID=702115 RepID=A0A1H0D3T9_9PSED|nr:hypothetical protein [Pseudomonas arsenicoxydans]SDN64840.1 hypothetical protein SAMN04489798_0815 [Pseudomonas arsenicoxydans]
MLKQVQSQHFQALLGKTGTLHLPDGSELPIHLDNLVETPRSQLPNSERMPFSVELNSLGPTTFVDGLCSLELPELGQVQDIFVSRVPAMGRDPGVGYFYIAFN